MHNLLFSLFFTLGFCGYVVVPLGTGGGITEGSLSSYAVASTLQPTDFILCDAGTVFSGAEENLDEDFLPSLFPTPVTPWEFIKNHVHGYLVSHAHLDHLSGLIINSVDDSSGKPIIGLEQTLDNIAENIFNWKVWPDFGPSGLGKYSYVEGSSREPVSIEGTPFSVLAFPVYHSYPYLSTAFFINDGEEHLLYFGDFGPDEVENKSVKDPDPTDLVSQVWEHAAMIILRSKLAGIFIECSYANGVADESLFGHLTPKWVLAELDNLNKLILAIDPAAVNSLKGLNVMITHIKPTPGGNEKTDIMSQLSSNPHQVNFIFPTQGVYFTVGPGTVEFEAEDKDEDEDKEGYGMLLSVSVVLLLSQLLVVFF
eukprot:TRINITY_DN6248_c0_g1_i2.p1 TRINITY_DN6248_c0_g1~~TRINITY_DN6248_c0_g1_i2.p1  ORF type:complete len:369 (-),score=64.61 TRINITY_DN6248_c0_g1_i2:267-1373(-)